MSLIGQITGLRPSKIGIPKLAIQIAVESQFGANIAILAINTEVRASALTNSFDAWASAQFLASSPCLNLRARRAYTARG
jgi:hypothetical protein